MTNPPPVTGEQRALVPVIQADRDAAAKIVRNGAPGRTGNKVVASGIKGGLHDNYDVVQAFARHRLAFAKEQAAGDLEGYCGDIADRFPCTSCDAKTPSECPHYEHHRTPAPASSAGEGELANALARLGTQIEAGEIAGGLTRAIGGKQYFVVSREQYERDFSRHKVTPPAGGDVQTGFKLVPQWLVDFLTGVHHWPEQQNVWFGDTHPDLRGPFFWRRELMASPDPQPAGSDTGAGEGVLVPLEDLEIGLASVRQEPKHWPQGSDGQIAAQRCHNIVKRLWKWLPSSHGNGVKRFYKPLPAAPAAVDGGKDG